MLSLKEKLVTAREVLAAGPQPRPIIETVIVTLMHVALYSEKVELEVSLFPSQFTISFSQSRIFLTSISLSGM